MKKRFSEEQIIGFQQEAETGLPVKELCRRHDFSEASHYLSLRPTPINPKIASVQADALGVLLHRKGRGVDLNEKGTIARRLGMVKGSWTSLALAVAVVCSPMAQAHFLSPDPKAPKPGDVFGFNRYAYANNNPVVNIDPNGQNAIVSYNRDGTINISVPINFSGPGASNPATIAAIKSDAATRWSGVYNVAGELTKVNVAITDVTPSTPKGAINNVTLTEGPTSDKAAQGASFVGGDHVSGEWNVLSSGAGVGMFAHETGHLMGDKDYYSSGTNANGNRTTTASSGYGNNLMGALSNSVFTDSRNMDVILHSPINIVQNPPPPPKQPTQ